VTLRRWFSALALGALLVGGSSALAEPEKKPKELASFGTLRAPSPDAARSQAQDWLKGVGKTDETTTKAFNAVWDQDRPLLDKVADTLALGDDEARKLLAEASNPAAPAPTAVPAP